jgi:hypothetical protein
MRKSSTPKSGKLHRLLSCSFILSMILSPLIAGHQRSTATPIQDDSLLTLGFTENFDGVTAPALPANWNSTSSGSLIPFVTSTTTPQTPPNALFVTDPNTVGLAEIIAPPVQIGTLESHVIFSNFYLTEGTFDGGVLEIKIGNGNFQDIIQAGGQFLSGGYNSTLSANTSNPLGGRMAWSGNSGGYITTEIRLPVAAAGQLIQLKWRMATDSSVAGTGWRIDNVSITNTITGENNANIVIPDSGPAATYPSTINISNLIGSVTETIVVLNNFSHTAPDDVDLLLVAPGGRKVVLMSDVGGTTPVSNLSLSFQDSVANSLPDNGPLVSGTFKPTNIGADDTFPAPAPSGPPTSNTLSALNGINPNGVWSLYLVDDNGNNAGSISGGWGMLIVTSATACTLNVTPSLQVFPITGGTGAFDVTTPFGCDWTATSLSSFVHITSGSSGSGEVTPINFSVEANMGAGRTGFIRVSNGAVSRDFGIQQPSGCPFTLSETAQQFPVGGGSGSVGVTAAGACGWSATTKDNWITINSGAGSGNGTVNFTVAPNPNINTPRTGSVLIGARTLTVMQGRAVSGAKAFDFDGDGKTDVSVFRPANATWYVSQSSNGNSLSQPFGLGTDRLAPADFDGDNKVDIAVFRNGMWFMLQSSNNTFRAEQWGTSGDVPVPADFDGDNKADLAVYRLGVWYVKQSSDGSLVTRQFGVSSDRPLPGDYDGDSKADYIVYRAGASAGADSFWYVLRSSDGSSAAQQFGHGEDVPVPGDYDGDAAINVAVFRPSNATWFTSLNPVTNYGAIQWGMTGDVPVAGDYDGDGKFDVAVFRQGTWHIRLSTSGALRSEQWGASGDIAVPSAFNSN